MSDGRWTARTLFAAAIKAPDGDRLGFVRQSDASEKIKAEVYELLGHHGVEPDSFLEDPLPAGSAMDPARIGHYRVLARIAAGGMGVVYRGLDERLNRLVAIKVLSPYLSDSKSARERLAHEARVVAKLDHPGIVQVYDVVSSDESIAIVSQYVDGGTLADLVDPAGDGAGTDTRGGGADPIPDPRPGLPEKIVVRLIRSVALALEHAHAAGVVHRDLKPSNILLDRGTVEPKLADFGIAKLLSHTEVMHTSAGAGTCYYMSPEQTRLDSEGVGPASDIFSLGVVMYELLTGRRPFDGPVRDVVIDEIRRGQPKHVGAWRPDLSRDAQTVCMKMIEGDRRHRYGACRTLVDDLDRVLAGRPILSTPPGIARRVRDGVISRRQALLLVGGVCVGLGGGAAWMSRALDQRGRLRVLPHASTSRIHVLRWDHAASRFDRLVSPFQGRRDFRFEEGMYRVVVSGKGSIQEFDRALSNGSEVVIDIPTPTPFTPAGMVRVSAPVQSDTPKPFWEQIRFVQPFWIDAHEVSNKQYREFVLATGREPPGIWPDPYDDKWDELPVTSLSADDARAYAEWRGRRLPTYAEWTLAARGASGDIYPWGAEPEAEGGESTGNWGGEDPFAKSRWTGRAEARESYLSRCWPVGRVSADRRDGVLNLMGNVSEWTSTPVVYQEDGVPKARLDSRYICGQSWGEPGRFPGRLSLEMYATDSASMTAIDRGFRCAASDPAG